VVFGAAMLAVLTACALVAARLFEPPPRSVLSLILQHASAVAVFLLLAGVARHGLARLLLFAALVSYALAVQAHTLSLALVSVPADAVVHLLVNGGDPAAVLQQAHVSARDGLVLFALVAAEIVVLGVLYRRRLRVGGPSYRLRLAATLAAALVAVSVGEQALARNSDEYLMRHAVLPGYYRLFAGELESFTFVAEPVAEALLDPVVDRVEGALNPKNVVFILLESFRYDTVGPELTPNLHELQEHSLFFTNAYSAATSTARVWNVLLLNRPAHMFLRDLEAFETGGGSSRHGAFPARILKRAGYEVVVSIGCQFDWHRFQERFMGEQGLVDRFYSSYPGHNRTRHLADDRATDEIVKWLAEPGSGKPFFLLTHLDSTHFNYFFHEEKAVVRPYSDAVSPRKILARSPESRELLFNRYKNAAAHVDFNIGRIVAALRASGRFDDTAIVIIADHGEGFDLGAVGHMQVNEVTKHVPLLMRLPGVAAARVGRLVTGGDVFPTLFDYLRIKGLDSSVLVGRSARSGPPRNSVLTLQAAMGQANLTFPLFTIVFELNSVQDRRLTFSPTTILGRDEKPISGWRELLATVPWRSEVLQNLTEGSPAEGSLFHSRGVSPR
jgi:glucan phosphoethanolaminetransferase (alkaline phosphatase superfamily)